MMAKIVLPVLSLVVFSVTLSYYYIQVDLATWRNSFWLFNTGLQNNSKILLEEEVLGDGRIYFLETSGHDNINYRQSCAVESAARQNPKRQVVLYVSSDRFNRSSPSVKLLTEYHNIQIEEISLDDYFSDTPLQTWYRNGLWRTSPYSVAHLSDYLRILSVYKGGGQYLDLDFVVTRSMEGLRNYVVYQSQDYFCNGVFHFDKGHPLAHKMIEQLSTSYNPNIWAAHGPDMVTSIIKSNCRNISDGFASGPHCGSGIRLVDSSYFFPFAYAEWKLFFENNTSYELPEQITKAYAIHMWNKLSAQEPVLVGSSQYYAILAAKYCPLSFASALNKFK